MPVEKMSKTADTPGPKVDQTEEFMKSIRGAERAINQYFNNPDITFTYRQGEGFFIDLEKLQVNLDPEFYTEMGLDKSEVLFGTFHEAEHFRDMMQNVEAYKARRARHREIAETDPQYSSALHRLHNIIDDVMVNMTVNGRWAGSSPQLLENMYHKLFPGTDYSKSPKFNQFSNAIIRELMIPGERTAVDPEVRADVDRLLPLVSQISGFSFRKQAAEVDPAVRISVIEQQIEPIFKKYWDEASAAEKEAEAKKGKKGTKGKPGEKTGETAEGKPADLDQADHDDILSKIGKLKKKIKDKKNIEKTAELGFDPEMFGRYKRELDKFVRPHMEGMVDFFKSFIKKRTVYERVKKISSRGDTIPPHLLNEAYIQAKLGQLDNSPVFERKVIREAQKETFTDFELTILIDGSGSMSKNPKEDGQRQAVMMLMEAINQFQLEVNDMVAQGAPLQMTLKTQIREFADTDTLLKDFNEELDVPKRLKVYEKLNALSGGTNNEKDSLEEILDDVSAKAPVIRAGKTRKLVLVITDGESNKPMIQGLIGDMYRSVGRAQNFKIIGVGIGDKALQVADTYAPNGHGGVELKDLPALLSRVLIEFIEFEEAE